jgi:hypothetical protein
MGWSKVYQAFMRLRSRGSFPTAVILCTLRSLASTPVSVCRVWIAPCTQFWTKLLDSTAPDISNNRSEPLEWTCWVIQSVSQIYEVFCQATALPPRCNAGSNWRTLPRVLILPAMGETQARNLVSIEVWMPWNSPASGLLNKQVSERHKGRHRMDDRTPTSDVFCSMWIKIYANGQRTRSSASCSTCRKAEKRFGAIGIWNSPHAIKWCWGGSPVGSLLSHVFESAS